MLIVSILAASLSFAPSVSPLRAAPHSVARPAVVSLAAQQTSAPIFMAVTEASSLIEQADSLHGDKDVVGLFELLVGADASNDDIAWRIARAHHDKAEETVGDDAAKEKLLRDGLKVAEESMARSDKNGFAIKWYAILLGRLGDFLPTKEKVANSYKIKDALEASAKLLPEDASIQTALGQWCFKVAGISFIERNAAKLLFGSPPSSSYEEALKYVEASYALRPSKKAALFAALCNDKLKKRAEAKDWASKCVSLESFGESDADLDRQAKKLL